MTALDKYARLEGPGVWRAGPAEQRRDVTVALGEASLVISDARSGHALSHWSLPAVQRLTRGTRPAIYAPISDGDGETLELEDALLIEALETIRAALSPRPPLRWLRLGAMAGVAVLLVAAMLWLPGVLIARTAQIVPPATRSEIAREALETLTAATGNVRICVDPEGRQALATLRNRVLGTEWRVSVVTGVPGFEAAHLPGQVVVLGEALIARLDSAEALAGWLVAEALARNATDPLLDVLDYAGVRATLALLTTGHLPTPALRGYARSRLARPAALPAADALGAWLERLGIAPTAYALSLPQSREALAQALADRPAPAALRDAERVLSDGEWLTLQAICTR